MNARLTGGLGEAQMRHRFWFGMAGSLLAGVSVALAAYAAHAALEPQARHWLQQAALFGFGHGVALAALAPLAVKRLTWLGLACLLLGVLLFSGSLALAAFVGTSTTLAPFGGGMMMLGWLLHAIGQWRR
ncbi:DUF423 domain-containing protein [Luteimonas sp. e5]